MSLKAKLVSVISAFVLILTIVIVSVWAVSQANVTMGGTVGFKADNVYAKISAKITGMDEKPTLPTLIFSEGDDASPVEDIEEWANLSLIFANSNTPIQLEITVENLSGERALYAKIDDQIGVVANLTKTVTSSSQDALGRYIEVPISSSISYTITLSPTDPNKSVNGEYRYLITLVDETEATGIQIQASANQTDLGQVTGGGMYDLGDEITLTATASGSNIFLGWATSLDLETMEIVSLSQKYSFDVSLDTPTTYYALFNSTTSTSQTVGDLIYTFYNEAGLAEITDAASSFPGGDYIFSSIVTSGDNLYRVYSIGYQALMGAGMNSLIIPEGVVSIGNAAFDHSYLRSVSIPNSILSIESGAFTYCNLTYYTDSDNNKYLGNETNNYLVLAGVADTTITEFDFPAGCKIIYNGAFSGCNNLTSITIPENITSIAGAFASCSNLETVIFEGKSQLSSIGNITFAHCTNLSSIIIPEGVTSIGNNAFGNCSSLTSIIIPEGVTTIEAGAFGYSGLTTISLPSTLTSIAGGIFEGCVDLTTIVVAEGSTLSAALQTYGTWVKDGGSETVTNFSGAGTYTRTDI